MAARVRDRGGRVVYRPLPARGLIVVFAVVGLWWDVDLLGRSRAGEFVLASLWLVAACAALVALFWRPAVIVDDDGAELWNVLRDVRVPWAVLEAVETRYALTLVCGGRRYVSWAGAAGGRPPRRRASELGVPVAGLPDVTGSPGPQPGPGPASRHPRSASGATAYLVEQRWQAWQQAAPTRRLLASRAAEPADAAGPPDAAGPAPGVVVRWRLVPAGAAIGVAVLAAALTPVLG